MRAVPRPCFALALAGLLAVCVPGAQAQHKPEHDKVVPPKVAPHKAAPHRAVVHKAAPHKPPTRTAAVHKHAKWSKHAKMQRGLMGPMMAKGRTAPSGNTRANASGWKHNRRHVGITKTAPKPPAHRELVAPRPHGVKPADKPHVREIKPRADDKKRADWHKDKKR